MRDMQKCWLWVAILFAVTACDWKYSVSQLPQTVSVTVSGLSGTGLVLQNSGGNNLAVTSNGKYTFATPVPGGRAYNVSVLSQPVSPNQMCTVTNGSGNISGTPVTNVQLACVILGDVNGDSVVDYKDAILAQRIALGLVAATPDQLMRGDIHADGKIDISDYLMIQKLGLGL